VSAITPYNRQANFTQWALALDHTSAPYNASDHDAEFDAIYLTLSGVVTNLNTIQRNDGLLANGAVHPDAFSTAAKALIGAGRTGQLNWTPRGLWVTATAYVIGDVVAQGATSYVCAAVHNSGVFATDLAAGKWVFLGGNIVSLAANQVTVAPAGNIAATDVQAALQELDSEKAKLAGDGTVNFSVKTATAAAHAVPMSQAQDGSLEFAVATGSGNALLATINPTGITVLKDGFEVRIRAPGANSITAPTLDLTLGTTDTGAITIVRGDTGGPLQVGDIAGASHELRLQYRSTTVKWALLNPGTLPSLYQQRAVAAGARRLLPRRQRHRAPRSDSRRLVPGVLQPAVGRCAALLRAGRYRDGCAVQVRGGDGVYRRFRSAVSTSPTRLANTWSLSGLQGQ
jgi:hypothetical protein